MTEKYSPETGVWGICNLTRERLKSERTCLILLAGHTPDRVELVYDALVESKIGGVAASCYFSAIGRIGSKDHGWNEPHLQEREAIESGDFFRGRDKRIAIAHTDDLDAMVQKHVGHSLLTVFVDGSIGSTPLEAALSLARIAVYEWQHPVKVYEPDIHINGDKIESQGLTNSLKIFANPWPPGK